MKINKAYILISGVLLLLGFTVIPNLQSKVQTAVLLTEQSEYTVGKPISLSFNTEAKTTQLIVSNALGTSIIQAEERTGTDEIQFSIAEPFCTSSGVFNWTLIAKEQALLNGKLQLNADTTQIAKLESYLGPQRIAAGGEDFAQFTILPTDIYDNPLPDETEISLNTGYASNSNVETLEIQGFISWKNVYSTLKSGRIFVAAHSDTTTSKLQTIYVDANLATDFNIDFERPNTYADADQITTLRTDVIKDRYNNTIPDATLVNFVIKTKSGAILQTSGNTINGIAQAQIQHPATPQNWMVTAYITGIAKSNPITIQYKPALNDIPLIWDATTRKLKIGPLNGILGQTLPEGTVVSLKIKNKTGETETLTKKTEAGRVAFELKKAFYPSGAYSLEICVLGVSKNLESVLFKS
ncbi:hypothetical protein ACFSYG_06465 [Leeuwenhoekiella polynyae]|uniref:Uncharacterized protein n=1 Tax=Leeuwenhoekiella polynyae TaxID=1550906 RepID=A0A4Q0P573_9FLAO|nr:hypothetical protein [Leeuwenhoekiella polynyae]RXG21754.1 hypothetical protein DSM02_2000 [Leeuwenhoekiella polynyae]